MRKNLLVFQLMIISVVLNGLIPGIAQTTKTTKADGFWSDPNTWTGGVIPDASNKATINNDVIIDMDVNILSLTINAASSLTFDTISSLTFTVADEIIVNGSFTVNRNKVTPLKHIVEVGADFYGTGSVDFYDQNGDMVELVFIGNSNSLLKDILDVTGIGGQGKFGGLKVDKSLAGAVVTLQKSLTINSGTAASLQGNVTILKGILDTDSCFIQAGDNANILKIDSLGKLFIASDDIHSCSGFEEYNVHTNSTIKYYHDGDYEMTKGWTSFDGNLGHLTVSGDGTKFFGDSVAVRNILGDFKIEADGNFNLDNDTVTVFRPMLVNGTLSTNNKNGQIVFNSLVTVSSTGSWLATANDRFIFRGGLWVSNEADFNGGSGEYIFAENDQELYLHDTIPDIMIDGITLISTDSLTCETLGGTGTLVNTYCLDFTGQHIDCNLDLDSLNNKVVYSNDNPEISSLTYQHLELTGSGNATLAGNIEIKKSLIKNSDGYITLGNSDLILDTATLFQFDNPSYLKMIVTGNDGKLIKRITNTGELVMVYPVGTITDTAVYSPFEISSVGKMRLFNRYIGINAVNGLHPGMEDTTGLFKYWSIDTDISTQDSISADISFTYHDTETGGSEEDYEVRIWTGEEPWIEPEDWEIDILTNQLLAEGVNDLGFDWTAGDSTALTSKINELKFSPQGGILHNSDVVTITTTTSDVIIYYTFGSSLDGITDSVYSGPIPIDSAQTITAIAFKDGWQNSDTAHASYLFMVDTVEFSIPAGSYSGIQNIELSCSTVDAEIRYTLDGSEPTESSAQYSGAISIETTTTIKAIAFRDKYLPSAVSEAVYTIELTNISLSSKQDELEIYPVPASDFILIRLRNNDNVKADISVVDVSGAIVQRNAVHGSEIIRIDITGLAPGAYFIILKKGPERISGKFIKK